MKIEPGYESIATVLQEALDQAQSGKGKERHANDLPFEEQPILAINRMIGSPDGLVYQVIKKSLESKRLLQIKGKDAAIRELLGVMNYSAAAIILIREQEKPKE